jgi:hypothetical protein
METIPNILRDIARELAALNKNIEELKNKFDNNSATSGGEK